MSRASSIDDVEVFRVIVTTEWLHEDGSVRHSNTAVRGPYRTVGAARGQLTGRTQWTSGRRDLRKTGHVERASVKWQPVP